MPIAPQGVSEFTALPLAPADDVLDIAHLARMTLGEPQLEREVLTLFDRQAGMLLKRMSGNEFAIAAAAAHTLKGSARGIGAWRIAIAAEAVELAQAAARPAAIAALAAAIDETRAAIRSRLQAH